MEEIFADEKEHIFVFLSSLSSSLERFIFFDAFTTKVAEFTKFFLACIDKNQEKEILRCLDFVGYMCEHRQLVKKFFQLFREAPISKLYSTLSTILSNNFSYDTYRSVAKFFQMLHIFEPTVMKDLYPTMALDMVQLCKTWVVDKKQHNEWIVATTISYFHILVHACSNNGSLSSNAKILEAWSMMIYVLYYLFQPTTKARYVLTLSKEISDRLELFDFYVDAADKETKLPLSKIKHFVLPIVSLVSVLNTGALPDAIDENDFQRFFNSSKKTTFTPYANALFHLLVFRLEIFELSFYADIQHLLIHLPQPKHFSWLSNYVRSKMSSSKFPILELVEIQFAHLRSKGASFCSSCHKTATFDNHPSHTKQNKDLKLLKQHCAEKDVPIILQTCSKCELPLYCNRTCQTNHWKYHKAFCSQ